LGCHHNAISSVKASKARSASAGTRNATNTFDVIASSFANVPSRPRADGPTEFQSLQAKLLKRPSVRASSDKCGHASQIHRGLLPRSRFFVGSSSGGSSPETKCGWPLQVRPPVADDHVGG